MKTTNPKVSIVITTWDEKTKPYLDLLMRSVANLNYSNLEVVLVARPGYMPTYDNVKTVAPDKTHFYNAEGLNFGVAQTDPGSKYLLLLNDDVVLTKDSLKNLVEAAGDQDVILNGVSPCDAYAHSLIFPLNINGAVAFLQSPQYRLDFNDLEICEALMNGASAYPQGIFRPEMLCFYATLIPRKVWERVGQLEEIYETGPDDLDYSLRAKQAGVALGIALNALIWHFGGVTSNATVSDERRIKNARLFKNKWGFAQPGTPKEWY